MSKKELIKLVKGKIADLPVEKIIKISTEALIGVSDTQAKILQQLNIDNINDLGLSDIFRHAVYITSISNDKLKPGEGLLTEEMVQEKALLNSLIKLKDREPALLTGVGDELGKLLQKEFGFKTISDLAKWPPYIAARRIVNAHLGITSALDKSTTDNNAVTILNTNEPNEVVLLPRTAAINADPEAPQDLVPKTGDYPVEIVYYDSVVMIEVPKRKDALIPITGRVALSYDDTKMGYDSPGFGAIITFKQSWFAEGITLGSLIKSIALAPGESTKIAVIDWQGTTTGTSSEDITQKEDLSSTQNQSRAIAEIAGATATEIQGGSSLTGSVSTSANAAVAGGAILPGPALVGGTASTSVNATAAATVTASAGQKDVSTNMQQNIDNSTQQNSFAARNKRSSLVTEVSQSETETITTRTITNYNHMHALTIQYWQVVQAFTTEVKVDRYKRCIFIPMDIINFNDERVISKFKSVLYNAAKTQYVRDLLVATSSFVGVSITARPASDSITIPVATEINRTEVRAALIKAAKMKAIEEMTFKASQNNGSIYDYNRRSWKMPGIMLLTNIKWETGNHDNVKKVILTKEDGSKIEVIKNGSEAVKNLPVPIPVSIIISISVEFTAIPEQYIQQILFSFSKQQETNKFVQIDFLVPANRTVVQVLNFEAPVPTEELGSLLNEEALYYSQQIWMNFDSQFLTMQLSPYNITIGEGANKRTLNITEYIDPKPIAVIGNCLAFIWHDEEDVNWKKWKADNIKEKDPTYQKIAIPTDGIFGEAVLGRFNSAEKLDMTRFWNWQDSPIPFSAPDIAAIQNGQHQLNGAQRPGNLDPSLLSIQQPQALPDPTGMQGIIQAITAANLFRDMSGIAQTSALAQGALSASSAGATAAGAQAGANMATFANFQVEMAKIVASLAPMLLGLPPVPSSLSKNISNDGALLNAAEGIDARQIAGDDAGSSSVSPASSGGTSLPAGGVGNPLPITSSPNPVPKSKNIQNVLERLTNTTAPPKISLPSSNVIAEPFLSTTGTSTTEKAQIKSIIDKAAASPNGTLTTEDEKQVAELFKSEFTKNIKPLLISRKDSFNTLKTALVPFSNWLVDVQLADVTDLLQKEINDGHETAKNALKQSLNTAISLAIKGNNIEQIKVGLNIIGTAQFMGYGDGNPEFSIDGFINQAKLSLAVDTIFEPAIKNGEQKRLHVIAELKIGDNEGIPLEGCPVSVAVTGGTVSPFSDGVTNKEGDFLCSVTCTDRAQLKIRATVTDNTGFNLGKTVDVPL